MTNGHADAFTEMAQGWQKLMMDNWSTWTKATVSSDAFAQTSASMMDWNLATQQKMQEMTGQYLEALDLPRRGDLARLSDQVLCLERRLADAEDERDELQEKFSEVSGKLDQIVSMLASMPAAPAPVAAAPAAEATSAKPKAKAKAKTKSKAKTKKTKSSK